MSLPCLSDLFNRNGIMLSIRIRKLFAAIFITLIVLSCVACSGLDMSLLQRDFQVYEATGVEEALKTFGVVQIHAICSDFNMKDGTGIELLERLYHALNFYITLCMAFLAHMSMKSETHALKAAIIQTAAPYSECQIQLFLITVSGNFILRVDDEFIGAIMYLYIKYNQKTKVVSYGNHYQ